MQLLLAQHPSELAFMQRALQLSDEERELVGRLKTVKGSHAQMLWINGTRGRGRVAAARRPDSSTGPSPPTRAATPHAARPPCASTTATPGRRSAALARTTATQPAP